MPEDDEVARLADGELEVRDLFQRKIEEQGGRAAIVANGADVTRGGFGDWVFIAVGVDGDGLIVVAGIRIDGEGDDGLAVAFHDPNRLKALDGSGGWDDRLAGCIHGEGIPAAGGEGDGNVGDELIGRDGSGGIDEAVSVGFIGMEPNTAETLRFAGGAHPDVVSLGGEIGEAEGEFVDVAVIKVGGLERGGSGVIGGDAGRRAVRAPPGAGLGIDA